MISQRLVQSSVRRREYRISSPQHRKLTMESSRNFPPLHLQQDLRSTPSSRSHRNRPTHPAKVSFIPTLPPLSALTNNSKQVRRNHPRLKHRRRRDPRQTAPQPPRLPPPLHLQAANNLDLLLPQPYHRRRPLRLLLPLRPGLPGLPATGMASRFTQHCRRGCGVAHPTQGGEQVRDCHAVHISQLQQHKASDLGYG